MCYSQPWLVRCHYCTPHHCCYFCTYIIYTRGGGWRGVSGGAGATGSSRRPIGLTVWRAQWMRGGSCHSGLWWLHAEMPLQHADRQQKDPTPPFAARAKYRRNRNKAESLCTLEVHWSKTMAWLFINQLSLAKCLLRWRAKSSRCAAASAWRQWNCWHNAT